MPLINHRQFTRLPRSGNRRRWRLVVYGLAGVLGLFLLVNGSMALAYRGRVLPGYTLSGVAVGNVSFAGLPEHLQGRILPGRIMLQKGSVSKSVSPQALGVSVDTQGSISDLKAARPVFPLMSVLKRHEVPARISIDTKAYTTALETLTPVFTKEPLMKRVVFTGSDFTIAEQENGYRLHPDGLRTDLVSGLRRGATTIAVPTTVLQPATASTDLNAEIQKLQKKLKLKPSFIYSGQTVQPSVRDIGSWYAADLNTLRLSSEKIGAYVDTIAPAAANRSDLMLAVQYTFGKDQSASFAIAPQGSPVRTYCTAVRGLPGDNLDDIKGKLAATYADPQGWNVNGRLAFQYVESGCEYTVWLSAPAEMTSFGEICDDFYNCQVGTNVIVNNDRWTKATEPWLNSGGNVEDYRVLVINHETGHRLGFYDNNDCPSPGGPAPVMMQQSIDLHGCTFNRFPTAAETDALRAKLGL